MNKKFFAIVLSLMLCGSVFVFDADAQKQTKTKTAPTNAASKTKTSITVDPLMASLPPSDVVVAIDVKRLLNEFVPKILSESPDALAKFNAQLDMIKSLSGLDLRQFDKVVAGLHFIRNAPNKLSVETIAMAKSSYPAELLIGGAKLMAKDKFKLERYGNKTITVFDLSALKEKAAEAVKEKAEDDKDKVEAKDKAEADKDKIEAKDKTETEEAKPEQAGQEEKNDSLMDRIVSMILGQNLSEVAVVAFDDKTLAIGKLSTVKAALDSATVKNTKNAAINELAMKNPGAVISFGGNVPENVSAFIDEENEFAKQLDSIKQVFGSLGMSGANYELALSARAINAKEAKNLHDVLGVLKSLGSGFLQGRNDQLSKVGAGLIEGLKTRNDGKDIHLKIEMKQSDVNGLLKLF